MTKYGYKILLLLCAVVTLTAVVACARMGNPDGGWYDELPPYVVSASPADRGVNAHSNKVEIRFNEFIKIDNASEKVVVSPPQAEVPEIKATGKKIVVELKDTLRDNTTYTIDFSDAISDNNENNPFGNYTYSFSTGDHIDTLEVSGTVLNAENLEPVKGTLVGLYPVTPEQEDSVRNGEPFSFLNKYVRTSAMLRVSRTDSRGRFIIRGIAPGAYRVVALSDMDGDFRYSQASEAIAFDHDIIVPSCGPDTRQDTIWHDSLHIKDIKTVGYMHFRPDDLVLRQFVKDQLDRFYLKNERKEANMMQIFFSGPSKQQPVIRGLNFSEKDAFVIEPSPRNDTITYWLRDSSLINQDTLRFEMTYEMTDSIGNLVPQTDTLEVLSKQTYEKRMKDLKKEMEDWYKKLEKRRKKSEVEITDTIFPVKPLEPKYDVPASIAPDYSLGISFPVPMSRVDTSAVHLYVKKDDEWYTTNFAVRRVDSPWATDRDLEVVCEWVPGLEYSFEVDTLAFEDIYGHTSMPKKSGFKVREEKEFSSLFVNITGFEASKPQDLITSEPQDLKTSEPQNLKTSEPQNLRTSEPQNLKTSEPQNLKTLEPQNLRTSEPQDLKTSEPQNPIIVQLLDKGEKVIKSSLAVDGTAEFYYVKPGEYYLRAIIDANGNGKWDTGDFDRDLQPEAVYYCPEKVNCRENWDVTKNWNILSTALDHQKPSELVKQKADKARKTKNRNAQRAAEKGIQVPAYLLPQ